MKKLAHSPSVQDMIRNVLSNATEKLASDEGQAQRILAYEAKDQGGWLPEEEEAEDEVIDSDLTNPVFVEKLASACDMIAANVDGIETRQVGVLQAALDKQAQEGSAAGPGKRPGALEVSKSIGGSQKYKKDKPSGPDAAASQAKTPLGKARPGTAATQLDNNMHNAPGGGSVKPTGRYPAKGPLVNKTAGRQGIISAVTNAGKAVDSGAQRLGKRVTEIGLRSGKGSAARLSPSTARRVGYGTAAVGAGTAAVGAHALGHRDGEKTASIVRSHILRKLAGEDVMKANISASRNADPSPGGSVLEVTDASKKGPKQPGDPTGGFGNQARKLIASNSAAINATKKDAKGPVKSQLKEVLDEPALSKKTDSKLQENLRNTGKAGVKIAAARQFLSKIASEGCQCENSGECKYCQMKAAIGTKGSEKTANAMMGYGGGGGGMGAMGAGAGGGMSSMADAGAGVDGCQCGGTGECRVCKLKAALAAAKAQSGMPDTSGAMGGEGLPVGGM